jgi:hypothetical protein
MAIASDTAAAMPVRLSDPIIAFSSSAKCAAPESADLHRNEARDFHTTPRGAPIQAQVG